MPARYGGFEECAERVGLGLARRGWQVTVFCPHSNEYRSPTYRDLRLRYAYHGPGVVGSVLYDVLCLLHAAVGRIDVVLMLGYSSSFFCFIPRLLGKRVVINTDGLEWRRSKWPWVVRAYLRLAERSSGWAADTLVSDSRTVQSYQFRAYRLRSRYIPYGADEPDGSSDDPGPEALRRRWGLDPESYYIVVARLEPENSIREAVEGFLAADTDRLLVIVGLATKYFERSVRPLFGTNRRVRYLGAIYERRELDQLRRHAAAYLHGHTVGGTNPALLEAMALGTFVIARDVPFNREVLADSGMYFRSSGDLARQIEFFETLDAKSLDPKIEAGRLRIRETYSWDRVISRYEELFLALLGRERV